MLNAFPAILIFEQFAPTQATGWMMTAFSTLMMGFAIYEPIGIVAGVALGELPQLWKMLHEHGDQVDKELDAVIMVQSVWRAKKQSKRYRNIRNDNRGAQAAIDERRARELSIWNEKHADELNAIIKMQSAYRGLMGRRVYGK